MIKTYIYGTPHGFNLYEKESSYDNFFKGFYISSRRNRRLMVNRQANGITTYNYLKYDILEVEGRPHAFFGMTLMIDDYKFCPNFKEVLKWFDWLFDKIANEKSIFIRNVESGTSGVGLKYAIYKFDECSKDIEWLKGVLPNIFSVQAKTSLLPIDSSFDCGKTGQVAGLNDEEDDDVILKAFKKYPWIAIAPEYQVLKTSHIEDAIIDLDYGDLCKKLNEYNSSLLPLAIEVSKANRTDLVAMQKSVNDSIQNLESFCKGTIDQEVAQKFNDLLNRYNDLAKNLFTLISKKAETEHHTQYCYSCKQYKDISEFRDARSTKCISCESKEKRTCRICGGQKSLDHFVGDSDICNECRTKGTEKRRCQRCHRTLPLNKFATDSVICDDCSKGHNPLHDHIKKPQIIALVTVLLIGALSFIFIHSQNLSDNSNRYANNQGNTTISSNHNVDVSIFDSLICSNSSNSIKDAYNYLSDKTDKEKYYKDIMDMIDEKLWLLIDNAPAPFKIDDVTAQILRFTIDNQSIISEIGYDDFDIKYWNELARDYDKLSSCMQKGSLTYGEYSECNSILQKYSNRFDESWRLLLQSKKITGPSQPTSVTAQDNIPIDTLSIVIKKIDKNGESELEENTYTNRTSIQIMGVVGQFVIIKTNIGKISFNNSIFDVARPNDKTVRIQLTQEGDNTYTVLSDNNIKITQITISARRATFEIQ